MKKMLLLAVAFVSMAATQFAKADSLENLGQLGRGEIGRDYPRPSPRPGGYIYIQRYQAEDLARRMYVGALGRQPEWQGFENMTRALMEMRTEQDVFTRTWDFLYKWPEFSQHVRRVGSYQVAAEIIGQLGDYNDRWAADRMAQAIDRGSADIELAQLILNLVRRTP